ncbi:MAG: TatD family hydrolase [Deltaproteobacteria bacterium]|nr:TatD family hydrolase [Deltaproteobacteria bacterium]
MGVDPLYLLDSHCHLTDSPLCEDREAVLQRAAAAGVRAYVVPGYNLLSSRAACRLAAARAEVVAGIGLHPAWIEAEKKFDPEPFRQLARLRAPRAIGEIGLDYALPGFQAELQAEVLTAQLELAELLGLPVILHCRRAFEPLYLILRKFPRITGVIHAFAGGLIMAEKFMELGYYLGLGGALTRVEAQKLRQLAAQVPAERLLLETDAPYLGSATVAKGQSQPADLAATARALAEIRGWDLEEVAAVTLANARRLFGDVFPEITGNHL